MDMSNFDNIMGMMGEGAAGGMDNMRDMMIKMMPQGLTMVFAGLDTEKRLKLVNQLIASVVEKGSQDLEEEDRKKFIQAVIQNITEKQ